MASELQKPDSKDIVKQGCAGGCLGAFGGGFLILVGLLLCLTGIGAIIGIPLIIIGFIIPFVGGGLTGLVALGSKKGACPYCGYMMVVTPAPGIDCPSCKKRVLNRGGKLQRLEE